MAVVPPFRTDQALACRPNLARGQFFMITPAMYISNQLPIFQLVYKITIIALLNMLRVSGMACYNLYTLSTIRSVAEEYAAPSFSQTIFVILCVVALFRKCHNPLVDTRKTIHLIPWQWFILICLKCHENNLLQYFTICAYLMWRM